MSPGVVVVVEVGGQSPPQRGFTERDDMIQAVAANRADDALDIGSLPGRSRSGEHFLNAEILNLFGEVVAEDLIAIAPQRSIPGQIGELAKWPAPVYASTLANLNASQ